MSRLQTKMKKDKVTWYDDIKNPGKTYSSSTDGRLYKTNEYGQSKLIGRKHKFTKKEK